jgi:hypothetical protein
LIRPARFRRSSSAICASIVQDWVVGMNDSSFEYYARNSPEENVGLARSCAANTHNGVRPRLIKRYFQERHARYAAH